MPPLKLMLSGIPEARGDLRARISDDSLLVPQNVLRLAESCAATTSDELLAVMENFPFAVAAVMGWRLAEVRAAARRLRDLLHSAA